MVQRGVLGLVSALLLTACASTPELSVESTELDARLFGQWNCRLKISESSAQAIGSWTETLYADGALSGQGSSKMSFGDVVVEAVFSGTGRWTAASMFYKNDMQTADVQLRGDAEVIARINSDKIRQAFLAPSTEAYELADGNWIRRKAGESNVAVCERAL